MKRNDKLSDSEVSPMRTIEPGVKMRDVAEAAGVSVATVSNVINHPRLVAAATLKRVQDVVHELDFQPDPHAQALRKLGASIPCSKQESASNPISETKEATLAAPRNVASDQHLNPANSSLVSETMTPGDRISLRVGHEALSGIVDAVMPDGSCFWIWADGGMGRRMFDSRDALILQVEPLRFGDS